MVFDEIVYLLTCQKLALALLEHWISPDVSAYQEGEPRAPR